jgi:hypothetical protein
MRHRHRFAGFAVTCLVLGVSPTVRAQGFATEVVEWIPGPGVTPGMGFGLPARALGGPQGEGHDNGSLDVLVLGAGGHVVLGFGGTLFDAPGPDLTVFENGFFFGGGFYGELLFVEVSSDGVNYARFPSRCDIPAPLGLFDTYDPALVGGLAGNREVYANVVTNAIDPFDPAVSGGDAFDFADLASDPLVLGGVVDLGAIRFVRLRDIIGDGSSTDSAGDPIYDPTSATASADLDAVAALHLDLPVAVENATWSRVKALWR